MDCSVKLTPLVIYFVISSSLYKVSWNRKANLLFIFISRYWWCSGNEGTSQSHLVASLMLALSRDLGYLRSDIHHWWGTLSHRIVPRLKRVESILGKFLYVAPVSLIGLKDQSVQGLRTQVLEIGIVAKFYTQLWFCTYNI